MGWSVASLSANEIAWAAADKPMLSSNSGVVFDDMRWVVGKTDGTWADSSDDATGFDAYRAVDGFPGRVTKPNAADTEFTLLFDWSSNPIEFDWFGVMNHNLYTLSCTSLQFQISDSSGFGTRLAMMSTTNVSTGYSADRRLAELSIGTGDQRFSGVMYGRIGITCSSGVPEIGQVILGRRRQQQFQPSTPWDLTGEASAMDDFTGRDGMLSRQTRYKARREMDARWRHSEPALQSDVLAWWDGIEEGGQPFYFTDLPASYPDDFSMMMMRSPVLRYPKTTSTTRDLNLNAVEQGPTFFSLE